jgi:hypothetical protein
MSRSKVSQAFDNNANLNGNGNGPVALPEIDLAELQAEPATSKKLSVEADYDLETLRAGPDAEATAEPDFDTVVVEKPKKTMFVNVHPEWRFDAWVLLPEESEWQFTHLLVPGVAKRFPQICRRVRLAPYADRENGMYLWPLLLEDSSGTLSKISSSALGRVQQGAGQWCRYEAFSKKQRYNLYFAEDQIPPPEWPAEGLSRLVKAAFQGHIIANTGAEILRQRLGRQVE